MKKKINTRQHWIRNNLKDKKIKEKYLIVMKGLNFDIFYFIYLFNNFKLKTIFKKNN